MNPEISEEIMKEKLSDQVVNMFSKILLKNILGLFYMSDFMLIRLSDEIIPIDSK